MPFRDPPAGDPIDLRRVQQFLYIANRASFTRAAADLHLTQQALSTSIAKLEAQLGVALFTRGPRQVGLTRAGEVLREGAGVLLAAAAALTRQTQEATAQSARPFVVGHTPPVSPEEVHRILAPVRTGLPGTPVIAAQVYPNALESALLEGKIDVALRRGVVTPVGMVSAIVAYDPARVALRRDHRLVGRASLRVEDLRGERVIVWAPPGSSFYTDFILGTCRRAGFEPEVVVNRVQGTPPASAVLDNDGIAFVTDPPGPAMGGQVVVVEVEEPPLVPVQALWLPHTVCAARSVLTEAAAVSVNGFRGGLVKKV